MPNVSIGYAQVVTQDASAGDVAWTNPANAQGTPDTVDPHPIATSVLTAANPSTQYLIAKNFDLDRPVPEGASIVGIALFVMGRDEAASQRAELVSNITNTDIRLTVDGGTTLSPTNQAAAVDQPLGRHTSFDQGNGNAYEAGLIPYGGHDDTWGLSISRANIVNDDLEVWMRWTRDDIASETDVTAAVSTIGIIVYWEGTKACVITPVTATTGMAPCVFGLRADKESVWGDSLPEDVEFSWEVTGPEGWTYEATDLRDGFDNRTLDLTDERYAVGYNFPFVADVAGTYNVRAKMRSGDDVTVSDWQTFTANANTRTVTEIGSGEGKETNFSTITVTNDMELVIDDDYTFARGAVLSVGAASNVWIRRSGGGTNRPKVQIDNVSDRAMTYAGATNLIWDGIDIEYTDPSPSPSSSDGAFNQSGGNATGVCFRHYESTDAHRQYSMTSGGSVKGFLVHDVLHDGTHRPAFLVEVECGSFVNFRAPTGVMRLHQGTGVTLLYCNLAEQMRTDIYGLTCHGCKLVSSDQPGQADANVQHRHKARYTCNEDVVTDSRSIGYNHRLFACNLRARFSPSPGYSWHYFAFRLNTYINGDNRLTWIADEPHLKRAGWPVRYTFEGNLNPDLDVFRFFDNRTTIQLVHRAAHNRYYAIPPNVRDEQDYNLAQWQALDRTENEDVENIASEDVTSANLFFPDVSQAVLDDLKTVPPLDGVYRDYRCEFLDRGGGVTWYAGASQDSSLPNGAGDGGAANYQGPPPFSPGGMILTTLTE